MKTETIKSIQRVYDETLRTISLKQLQERHWDDQQLMEVINGVGSKDDPNEISLEALQHKLHCLEILLKGEENGSAI